jgi:hypothetical protein
MGPLVDAGENLRLPLSRLDGLDIEEYIETLALKCELDRAHEVLPEVLATMAEKYGFGAHTTDRDAALSVTIFAMRWRVVFNSRVTVLLKIRGLFMGAVHER